MNVQGFQLYSGFVLTVALVDYVVRDVRSGQTSVCRLDYLCYVGARGLI